MNKRLPYLSYSNVLEGYLPRLPGMLLPGMQAEELPIEILERKKSQ